MTDDAKTPMQCRGCWGHYLLGKDIVGQDIVCRWCTEGWMNNEQYHAYMRAKSGPRPAARVSTKQFDPHRITVLERLERAWAKAQKDAPGMRLGHLILEAMAFQHMAPETLAALDDKRLAEIVEHYVMFKI